MYAHSKERRKKCLVKQKTNKSCGNCGECSSSVCQSTLHLHLYNISVTLICVPMAVGQALYRVWVYGDVMCKLTSYLQGTIQYYIIKFNSILFNFSSKSCFMVLFSKRLFIHVHVFDLLHFCNLLLKVNAFRYYIS